MRFTSLLPAFLASILASASPVDLDERSLDHLTEGEVHLLKRTTVITPRDIELAERDGVDPNQMYRHSMVKRDDGDHVTIWVDNSYNELEHDESDANGSDDSDRSDDELSKRQSYRVITAGWESGSKPRHCNLSRTTYVGDTGPNAPFTGGANAIIGWSTNCRGAWGNVRSTTSKNLIVAGSNRGRNMRFRAAARYSIPRNVDARVGCRDVGLIIRGSRDRFQRNINGWRLRARGTTSCDLASRPCTGFICPNPGLPQTIDWWIGNWDGRV